MLRRCKVKSKAIFTLHRLLIATLLVFYLSVFNPVQASSRQVKIKDLVGRVVEVPGVIDRIVCAGPGALRLVVYLEATDKLVGVEDCETIWGFSGRPYAIAHKEFIKSLLSIGPGGPGKLPNDEALIKLSPDVIFMSYIEPRIADNIQSRTHIPVVVLSYGETGFDEPLFKSLELAGKLLGKEKRAEKLLQFIKQVIDDLQIRTENIQDEEKPTVYVGGVGYGGAHGIESTEAQFPPFVFLHAKNVVDEIGRRGHVFIDKEKLLEWNPHIIFIDEAGLELVKQDYQKRPQLYRSLKAFKSGDIYGTLPFNFYATNLGTALADAYYIGKVIYPDEFKDIEPEKKADDIYRQLVGEFIYKEMEKDFGGFGKTDLEKGSIKKVSSG
ncbi:iron ABC transporter substrate-binding protein [Candidatus Aerophobetes bacterium]|nr:iron ABC transporter substrate-binding protein [Candidatus Aerophobetes bacterium]